jgi:hypothetical protein
MDREADCFELLSQMKDSQSQFVIRVCRDRLIQDDKSQQGIGLFQSLQTAEVKIQREVPLGRREKNLLPRSRKAHPPRQQRMATLNITASKVELMRTHHNDSALNKTIPLNIIHVFESNPPPGEQAVDWKLFTTESIDSLEQIESIVDIYRCRWLIEEYFKAVKSGCSFENRQLETKDTILNALGIFIPIAWRMLLLRTEARQRPQSPAYIALTPTQISVLKAVSKVALSPLPNVSEAIIAVAALGGHLKQNGPPGWKILSKGFTELLTLEKGWIAKERCDQS